MHYPMAIPRSLLVDPEVPLFYHLGSNCVRGAWLFGEHDGKDYSYRKRWVEERIRESAHWFAIEIYTFVVMANHMHILVYHDPKACETWSDYEVAYRWFKMFPPRHGKFDKAVAKLLDKLKLLEKHRRQLGSMSEFMKHLKGPIAKRANKEDGVHGHFFAKRFYSGAIIDEESMLAAMSYIDLNPFKAQIADTLEEAEHCAVLDRLAHAKNTPERLEEWLEPVVSGLEMQSVDTEPRDKTEPRPGGPRITLGQYLEMLCMIMHEKRQQSKSKKRAKNSVSDRWDERVKLLSKRQRAYGTLQQLEDWTRKRSLRCVEQPLP